jgi:site-specific DNA recombinase
MAKTNLKPAVAYARFSSDMQKDRSIDDQLALCQQIAERNGYKIIRTYSDRAKSASTMFERDGLLALMTASASKKPDFEAVIAEGLDRLSRDQEDTAAIFKRLRYKNIKIVDINGDVSDIHIGVGGIVNSMFLKNLGDKVRRGLNGRVRDGKIPGKLAYGYRLVEGQPGMRKIDRNQADVVERIFREYAAGTPVREIAIGLTKDGIPSPSGRKDWGHQVFAGGGGNRRGIIGNPIYIGQLVWNTHHAVRNPDTGKRTRRSANPEDVIRIELPDLRIIDQDLWDAAHAVKGRRAEHRFGSSRKPPAYSKTKKENLLAGLLRCAVCGGNMRITRSVAHNTGDGPRVGCTNGFIRTGCEHRRSYDLAQIERTVILGVKNDLDVDALMALTQGAHEEWQRRQKTARTERDAAQKQLNAITVKIDRYVNAIGDGEAIPAMMDKLRELEMQRAGLQTKLSLLAAEGNIVTLHPAVISKFRETIVEIVDGLTTGKIEPSELPRFRSAFRNMFERIVVHPTDKRKPCEVTPYARLSAIMGVNLFPTMRTPREMLAEQGLTNTFLSDTGACAGQKYTSSNVVFLGRWRAAA